jgi:flagellar motility protein MotE (MotC chaperone)
MKPPRVDDPWAEPPVANRRPLLLVLAFGAGLLVMGTGTAALANASTSPKPDVAAMKEYCTLEQQGAHKLVEDLRHRKREVESREQAIDAQRAELETAEARLRDRLAEIEKTRAEVTALIGEVDEARAARVGALVKMIEANRPASASGMFAALDEALAVEVLDRMNRTKAGRLLANLPPAKAARLAERMTAPVAVEMP